MAVDNKLHLYTTSHGIEKTGDVRSISPSRPAYGPAMDHDAPIRQKPMRIGIVGCGRVATHHVRFISQMSGVEIVGFVDRDEASAKRLRELYKAGEVYQNLESMVEHTAVDVLHIVTPPDQHYRQASFAIDRGINVLIEKPVTFKTSETEDLYRAAASKNVLICPDFIQLFHPVFLKARALVESGTLGRVVSVQSHLSQILNMPELREARELHWSYQLPGGALHNYLTHPLYLSLFFVGAPVDIKVTPRTLGALPQGLTDHLEVLINASHGSATVVVSHAVESQPTYFVNIFCERGTVSINFDTATVLVSRSSTMPRSIDRATANFRQAAQLCSSGLKNIFDFLRGRLVPYQGLQELIPQFYESIRTGTAAPISPELTRAVVYAEEHILERAGKLHVDLTPRPARRTETPNADRVLVTGAAGYVGFETVRQLVAAGYCVRALVRPMSHIEALEELGVEIIFGDVRNRDCCVQACRGMNIVVHAAAGLRGSMEHIMDSCVLATQNVAEAASLAKVRRVIYLSSMSVYDFSKLRDGDAIDENSPLDNQAELRGAYSLGKRKAEEVAMSHLQDASPLWTIVRPSVIVGNNRDLLGVVGSKVGSLFIAASSPKRNLRLVHVADVASCIVRLIHSDSNRGDVFVISSPEKMSVRAYVDMCAARLEGKQKLRVLYVPRWFAAIGVGALMVLRKITGRGPSMNFRRLNVLYRDLHVNTHALEMATMWQPPAGLLERLRR